MTTEPSEPGTRPTAAASVVLARSPGSPEVFLVRRSAALRFFGDFWAFPGGKVDPRDSTVAVLPIANALSASRAAAARELFEETGVLLARAADGTFLPSLPDLDPWRREILEDRLSFAELLLRLGLTLHAEDFRPLGSLTTPAFAPVRFETTFLVAHLPPGQEPAVWPGELDAGRWASGEDMLGCWQRGECLVSPPTVAILDAIRGRAADEAPDRLGPLLHALAGGALHPIFFAPQVQMIPLRTLALAPSSHTNAYLVGRDPAYLLDPGPSDPGEQQRLFDLLDAQLAAGHRLRAIVLTHHHPDHVGAAAACAARYDLPVWAHPHTAEALRGKVAVARFLHDGDRIDLGACPDESGPWALEAIHTPGHAPGHLAFWEARYRLLLVGDMVSTLSSIVIAPPEGDLGQYLDSLRRLQRCDCRLLLPAHGNASPRPAETLREALEHRTRREEQLLEVLAAGPRTIAELGVELYRGLPANLMRFAHLQILAGLEKLQREGRAGWFGDDPERHWGLL